MSTSVDAVAMETNGLLVISQQLGLTSTLGGMVPEINLLYKVMVRLYISILLAKEMDIHSGYHIMSRGRGGTFVMTIRDGLS